MEITPNDINAKDDADQIGLFYRGIRYKDTKKMYGMPLRYVLCNMCKDQFSGTFEEHSVEPVQHARQDPGWALIAKIISSCGSARFFLFT